MRADDANQLILLSSATLPSTSHCSVEKAGKIASSACRIVKSDHADEEAITGRELTRVPTANLVRGHKFGRNVLSDGGNREKRESSKGE